MFNESEPITGAVLDKYGCPTGLCTIMSHFNVVAFSLRTKKWSPREGSLNAAEDGMRRPDLEWESCSVRELYAAV